MPIIEVSGFDDASKRLSQLFEQIDAYSRAHDDCLKDAPALKCLSFGLCNIEKPQIPRLSEALTNRWVTNENYFMMAYFGAFAKTFAGSAEEQGFFETLCMDALAVVQPLPILDRQKFDAAFVKANFNEQWAIPRACSNSRRTGKLQNNVPANARYQDARSNARRLEILGPNRNIVECLGRVRAAYEHVAGFDAAAFGGLVAQVSAEIGFYEALRERCRAGGGDLCGGPSCESASGLGGAAGDEPLGGGSHQGDPSGLSPAMAYRQLLPLWIERSRAAAHEWSWQLADLGAIYDEAAAASLCVWVAYGLRNSAGSMGNICHQDLMDYVQDGGDYWMDLRWSDAHESGTYCPGDSIGEMYEALYGESPEIDFDSDNFPANFPQEPLLKARFIWHLVGRAIFGTFSFRKHDGTSYGPERKQERLLAPAIEYGSGVVAFLLHPSDQSYPSCGWLMDFGSGTAGRSCCEEGPAFVLGKDFTEDAPFFTREWEPGTPVDAAVERLRISRDLCRSIFRTIPRKNESDIHLGGFVAPRTRRLVLVDLGSTNGSCVLRKNDAAGAGGLAANRAACSGGLAAGHGAGRVAGAEGAEGAGAPAGAACSGSGQGKPAYTAFVMQGRLDESRQDNAAEYEALLGSLGFRGVEVRKVRYVAAHRGDVVLLPNAKLEIH